ncbi:dihydropyrimidine dehydrogenase [Haloferax elongans ATCC BAA-1513]|uniref:Dihydropyrimidine dehydrogenase n=1 Tax=Haloferax elongans ATCC BAA-1513 TaxID=1230453 RepID=M0HFA1_HALEO|nr:tRNA-dihydrouridine synthase [Haloferax elongans]ELZ82463.1 dihydropyrimidine dehydrogenase [Haloferax elongans ATCC BAA-1513]
MFAPRVAVASLSGESDADWARAAAPYVGAAFLGGVAIDEAAQEAAEELVARDRSEFITDDPTEFIDEQLAELDAADGPDIFAAVNVRATTVDPIGDAASVCADHGAGLEINAHCRQDELCAVGCGEALLRGTDRLVEYVETARAAGAEVGVKVRTEVEGVDLSDLAAALADADANWIHVDAMDSEAVVADVVAAAPDLFVIANNGVRDRETVREYLDYGADAVSVGRPSDNPEVLQRVRAATDEWFAEQASRADSDDEQEATV